MAPRMPETLDAFLKRVARQIAQGHREIRFGENHATHALCLEDGYFRVRKLELSNEEANAYLKEHGIFMPEHAEALSKPGSLVHESESLNALSEWFESQKWPM